MGIFNKLFGRDETTQQQQTGRQVESQSCHPPPAC